MNGSDKKYKIINVIDTFRITAIIVAFSDTLILFIAKSKPSVPNKISIDAV